MTMPPPTLIDITFGFFPFLAFGFLISLACLPRQRAERLLIPICIAAIFIAATRLWNDGSYLMVLSPIQALISMLTLGVWPLHVGPNALIRFLPIMFALSLGRHLLRMHLPWPQVWKLAGGLYLLQSILVYAMSWIGAALTLGTDATAQTAEDTLRLLVRAQANGFWTRGQLERFLAPIGQQSENSLLAIHASILFLATVAVLILFAVRQHRSIKTWVSPLIQRDSVLLIVSILIGLKLGRTVNIGLTAYTDKLAYAVFGVVAVTWLIWWRLQQKREPNEQPEGENSGSLLLLALFGAVLLGWSVLLALGVVTLLTWMTTSLDRKQTYESSATRGLGWNMLLTAACLGWAALAFSLRDLTPSSWMVRIVLASATLIGLATFMQSAYAKSRSRLQQVVLLTVGVALVLLIARQAVVWLLFMPYFTSLLIISRTPHAWRLYRDYPAYATLGALTLIVVLGSNLLTHE